jgi:hypothetical protein
MLTQFIRESASLSRIRSSRCTWPASPQGVRCWGPSSVLLYRVAVGARSCVGRLVGRLQLAAIVPVRASLVSLRRRIVAVNLLCRRVVLPQGEAENPKPRTGIVEGHSEDSEILAAGFFARMCALHHGLRDWRYSNGYELSRGGPRVAVAFVVVEHGYFLSTPHDRSVVDSQTNSQMNTERAPWLA